ncbi:MAG: transglutaminase-like domain-containing protein [Candidatus Bathyarchaeia archaeon]
MKSQLLAVAVALAVACLILQLVFSSSNDFLKYEVEGVFVGELKHTIQITNPWQTPIRGGKLIVPLVKNQTGRHYAVLRSVSASGGMFHGPTLLNYDSGNIYLYWSDITINPEAAFNVELTYLILSFSVKYTINASRLVEYNVESELYKRYTQPEQLIESDNPKIVNAAREIVGGEANSHVKALLIYNFVVEHLKYEVQKEEKGALWALENGVGDCSEYSYLFVALCRAAGIPARIQAGFAFHHDSGVVEDGHMWAEYYLEDYGWIPVDAAWRMFGQIDHRHLSSIQSIPEIPYANYLFNQTAGKKPEDKQSVRLSPMSVGGFPDGQFVEAISQAVQRIKPVELGVLLGKILGGKILFPSEVEAVELKVLESKICIQRAVDSWETGSKTALNEAFKALDKADEALKCAWIVVVKTFILYIGISLILAAIFVSLVRRCSRSLQQHNSYNVQ